MAFHTIQDAVIHKGGRWVDEHKDEAEKMGHRSEHPDFYETSQFFRNLPEAKAAEKKSQRAAVILYTGEWWIKI